jgi:hypothetical protein
MVVLALRRGERVWGLGMAIWIKYPIGVLEGKPETACSVSHMRHDVATRAPVACAHPHEYGRMRRRIQYPGGAARQEPHAAPCHARARDARTPSHSPREFPVRRSVSFHHVEGHFAWLLTRCSARLDSLGVQSYTRARASGYCIQTRGPPAGPPFPSHPPAAQPPAECHPGLLHSAVRGTPRLCQRRPARRPPRSSPVPACSRDSSCSFTASPSSRIRTPGPTRHHRHRPRPTDCCVSHPTPT